jgi:hypothetical protein
VTRTRRLSRAGWRRLAIGYAVLVLASWLLLLFLDTPRDTTSDPPPDLAAATPYLHRVSDALAEHHVYVDPDLRAVADLPSERELTGAPPVYVVAVPLSRADGSAGDATLTLLRLQRLVDVDGIYVLLDQDDGCHAVAVEGDDVRLSYCTDLAASELQRMRDDAPGTDRAAVLATRLLFPVLVAAGACLVLGWGLDAIGWLRRRRVSWLPGLR